MTASVFHHCHTRALQHAAHTSMRAHIPIYTHAGIFAAPRTSILMKTDLSSLKCLSSKTGLGFRKKNIALFGAHHQTNISESWLES